MSFRSTQLSGSLLLTYRELWATYVTIGLFIVATVGWIMLAFAMNLDVVEGSISALRIFGLETAPTTAYRDAESGELVREAMRLDVWVIEMQQFVFGASYFLGTLLALFGVAPLTASVLGDGRIGLLVSKPIGRLRLLAGHVFGVWLTGLVLSAYLVGSVWIVLSIKTGIWTPGFLWAMPVIAVMFAIMYGVVLLVSVFTRSAGAAIIAAYGLIFVSIILATKEELLPFLSPTGRGAFLFVYYALPNFFEVMRETLQLVKSGFVDNWFPIQSSAVFGIVVYALAALGFTRRDF